MTRVAPGNKSLRALEDMDPALTAPRYVSNRVDYVLKGETPVSRLYCSVEKHLSDFRAPTLNHKSVML